MTRAIGLTLLTLSLGLAWVIFDSSDRRQRQGGRGREESVRVAGADLALSSSSRWLRHPIESEPGAAFADAPCSLDVDPASILVSQPGGNVRGGARE